MNRPEVEEAMEDGFCCADIVGGCGQEDCCKDILTEEVKRLRAELEIVTKRYHIRRKACIRMLIKEGKKYGEMEGEIKQRMYLKDHIIAEWAVDLSRLKQRESRADRFKCICCEDANYCKSRLCGCTEGNNERRF